MASKVLFRGQEMQHMDIRIASRAISTSEVISWAAITIAMGLILTVIGASIYGSLGIAH